MFKEHDVFKAPENNETKVWRYMDLAGFVAMICSNSLFFRRADRFRDRLEGSFSRANLQMRSEVYSDMEDEDRQRMFTQIAQLFQSNREHTYINCWHVNERESAGMWDAYSSSNAGIAVQSTYSKLKKSFDSFDEDVYLGVVSYIDYDLDWMPEGNLFFPYIHKDSSFEYEKELRCITCDSKTQDSVRFDIGRNIRVELSGLVEQIIVAPYAQSWFVELVESLVSNYKINVPVSRSKLGIDPVF